MTSITLPPPPHGLIPVRDELSRTLGDMNVPGLSDRELTELLGTLETMKNTVEAKLVALAGEVHNRSRKALGEEALPPKFGCRNEVDYLQAVSGISRTEAKSRLRLAKDVGREITPTGHESPSNYETLAEAYELGLVPTRIAENIAQTLKRGASVETSELEYAEKCLVEAATGHSYGSGNPVGIPNNADSMRIICRTWGEVLDRDGTEPNESQILAKRAVRLSSHTDGTVRISGTLMGEVAALFGRLTDAINNPRNKPAEGPKDDRTHANRQHDAFMSILQIAARSEETPSLGGAPVTVLVQVSEEQLGRPDGIAWMQDHAGNVSPTSLVSANHSACSGSVQFFSQKASGRIVGLASANRAFTANQRRVIAMRDAGCVIPGCTVSAAWCEVHHVTPHAFGGKTHTDNGVLLCWYHHRSIDSSGWKIRMVEGVPEVKPPGWMNRGWVPHRSAHHLADP